MTLSRQPLCVSSPSSSKIDISQNKILEKCFAYLTVRNRDPKTLEAFKENGFCNGFGTIGAFGKFLELQGEKKQDENGREIPRDDWAYLQKCYQEISTSSNKISRKNRKTFERMIGLIWFNQSPNLFSSIPCLNFAEKMAASGLPFFCEYTFASLFIKSHFTQPIIIKKKSHIIQTYLFEELLKHNRITFICCYDHIVVAIKHKNTVHFYDPNHKSGWQQCAANDYDTLTKEIYLAFSFSGDKQVNSLSFYNVSILTNAPIAYTQQDVLLEALGPIKNVKDDSSKCVTALYAATEIGSIATVKYYLQHPPRALSEYVNFKIRFGDTALHAAAEEGHWQIVNLLLAAKAEVDLPGECLSTPLTSAINEYQYEAAKALLEGKANPNALGLDGETPLTLAIEKDFIDMVDLLLRFNASPNAVNKAGSSPLHFAAARGSEGSVLLLLSANADVNKLNGKGQMPLECALINRHESVVMWLLNSPHIRVSMKGYTLLEQWLKGEPQNKKLADLIYAAQLNILLVTTEKLVESLAATHPQYYAKVAKKTFTIVEAELKATRLSTQASSLFLLNRMLPILAWHEKAVSIWQTVEKSEELYELMKKFKITPEEVNVFEMRPTRHII